MTSMTERSPQEQLEIIERSTEEAKEDIALKDSVQALLKNRHFKKVIIEEYIKEFSTRLVLQKAAPSQQDPDNQAYIESKLNAIGQLNQFLMDVQAMGRNAERRIESNLAEADVIRAEHGVA